MKKKGSIIVVVTLLALMIGMCGGSALAQEGIRFTTEEMDFIAKTKGGKPVRMGIIPYIYPLSACPPETEEFSGIIVDTLALVSEKSGLVFEYVRVPTEDGTPYDFLKTGGVAFVAGTIRLDRFSKDPQLILSNRLSDGASVYISKKDFSPETPKSGKISAKHGYQAGIDNVVGEFQNYKIEMYLSNEEVISAVRNGQVDMAIINRYTGLYELQKPINSELKMIASKFSDIDSCVMGVNTYENTVLMSIINKALGAITPGEYNHAQMNFIISNPYKLTMGDMVYKYRHTIMAGLVLFTGLTYMAVKLTNGKKEKRLLAVDNLTGVYTELGFNLIATKIMAKLQKPMYIVDFDILNFQGYNELHGREIGDELLKGVADAVKSTLGEKGIMCRIYADNFRALMSSNGLDKLIEDVEATDIRIKEKAKSIIMLSYGIYCITDNSLPLTKMLDFAMQAKKAAKFTSDRHIGVFDNELYQRNLRETEMFTLFQGAIDSNEFLAYYQPKYDAISAEIVGAEALVRWRQKDGTILSPFHFIDLFEKNGQIRRLDFYMLNKVCLMQKLLLEKGIKPIPISVNFSKVHLYSDNLASWINDTVEKYGIPKSLIEIEWTETAIMNDNKQTEKILKELQKNNYIVSMDDFGSAYSSLNTLCNMPLDVIKLDREFMLNTLNEIETQRDKAFKIVRGIINLAGNLNLKVVAEGVETKEQYEFLKEVGCNSIQGYYFSKPIEAGKFVELMEK